MLVDVFVAVVEAGGPGVVEERSLGDPAEQGVPDRDVNRVRRRVGESREPGGVQGGDGEPEAGDGSGERVEVDAVDGVEGAAHILARRCPRLPLDPCLEQAVEGAEQEVARSARRVDQTEPGKAELGKGWGQRAVEDELLHEHRRLQQGVLLLRQIRQVLVQVAEKPGVEGGAGESVHQHAALAGLAPVGEQVAAGVVAEGHAPHQRVRPVEDAAAGRKVRQVSEGVPQPVGGSSTRVGPVERSLSVEGESAPFAGAGDPPPGDEVVVFAEADEHGAQHPGDRALGNLTVAPLRPRQGGASGGQRVGVLLPQRDRPRQVVAL